MSEFKRLTELQSQTGQGIQQMITNFRKDSSQRKSREGYYDERIRQLESLWYKFEETDMAIQTLPNVDVQGPYFTEGYYNKMLTVVTEYRERLLAEREKAPMAAAAETVTNIQDVTDVKGASEAPPRPTARHHADEANIVPPVSSAQNQSARAMIRRHSAMIQSLERLMDVASDSGSAQEQLQEHISNLWRRIEEQHYAISEQLEDPEAEGYSLNTYIELEKRIFNHYSVSTRQGHITEAVTPNKSLQLPKITIPKFDGNYLQWQQFSDIFRKMIHEQALPEVQKMWYLKTNISGEAERLIRHLTLSSDNYESAWTLMQERFNNKRVLTNMLTEPLTKHAKVNAEPRSIKAFHDSIHECLLALNNMGIDTASWDPLLLSLLVKRLDHETHMLYEQSLENPKQLQKVKDFLKFLENRFQTLEAVGSKEKVNNSRTTASMASTQVPAMCAYCTTGNHPLYYCEKFLNLTTSERLRWTQKNNLCVNCLKSGHKAKACASRSCGKCKQKHNSLLHLEGTIAKNSANTKGKTEVPASLATSNKNWNQGYVFLATAKVVITASNGRSIEVRAILDSGSQINLVSERLTRQLAIPVTNTSVTIEGIGRGTRYSTHRINVLMESKVGNFSARLEALVLPQIVSAQPTQQFDVSTWPLPDNINLADPEFNKTKKIDVLLGAEFYHNLLRDGQIYLGDHLPSLQNTAFGWVVCGKTTESTSLTATCGIFGNDEETTKQLVERFWKLDEFQDEVKPLNYNERFCETHFNENTYRTEEGRFVVKLPFSESPTSLGESKKMAYNRFLALERRMEKDVEVKAEYIKFMDEYERLGHMKEARMDEISELCYFIPHHCVLKPDSTTTKLRVVFDASAKTSSGLSLNDILHTGPSVQSEIFSILLRFRLHKYVFSTDVEKMYRQIIINPRDRQYQLIFWRSHPSHKIKMFYLNTVTYGTSSAPYLATKCLQQLAKLNISKFPVGAQALQDDFYVDDGLTGADNISVAMEKQTQLNIILKDAGLKLRKWCANHPQLLQGIPAQDREVNLDFSNNETFSIKTLGLTWLPKSDQFCVKTQMPTNTSITKRMVTADLARIFDPLGLLGPVVVTGKIFIQQLWQTNLSWDDELPNQLQTTWIEFKKGINSLNNVTIQRHMFSGEIPRSIQIHTFVDASEKAYGAAVYIRSTYQNGTIRVQLLCAKSRIAPIKTQTLPRLELCAAVLGAEITARVRKDLGYESKTIFLWTDSEIVLSWINASASSFHTFVANRVAKIQELSSPGNWRHVGSKDNPADLISRGVRPEKLMTYSQWFYGPLFLHGRETLWPQAWSKTLQLTSSMEMKKPKITSAITTENNSLEAMIYNLNHHNSFRFHLRVVAYMLRFISVLKHGRISRPDQIALSPEELNTALVVIVKTIQLSEFHEEIKQLRNHQGICKSTALSCLAPFLDKDGIVRVGGRLQATTLAYDAKHPMLLPYNDPLVKLLFKMEHENNKHCGPQALLAIIRQRFWPIKGKTTARSIVQGCIRCVKAKPELINQVMGNLPAERVTASRPFLNTGVDYCGPFWVHYKIRGKKPHKCYLAVFCCFATKAVHLELVTDLTTETFIGAVKRFVARRGLCQTIFCDNATNFVGAKRQLQEFSDVIHSNTAREKIIKASSDKGITFKFIPPRSPNFGGLWEAAVKSAKHLLIRSVSTASLTYEELETVIIEIEAILNSRPLTPLSSNPNDLTALTPGHFLIGEPLTAQPDKRISPSNSTLATRWRLVTQLKQEFWTRWSQEYLNELQCRHKWKTEGPKIKKGDMVLIKAENTPTLRWPLGRIMHVYPGDDGLVRVADVKTTSGIWKRSIRNLAPLPVNNLSVEVPSAVIKFDGASSQEQDNNVPTESRNKKRRIAHSSIMMTCIITLLMLPLVIANPINITNFNNTPGMYFEGIGTAKRITGEWKILVHYNLAPIRIELEAFNTGIETLQLLCHQIRQQTSCNHLTSHFATMKTDLLIDATLFTKRRLPRAAFDIIGNVANKLFGVLDSDYAEQMSRTIDKVNGNQNALLDMLRNQTSVVDSTINIIKDNGAATIAKINALQDMTNSISKDIGELNNRISILEVLALLTSQLSAIGANLQRIETAIINSLTDTQHGKISPLLLSPQQFRSEIINIKGHLQSANQLPLSQDDLIHYYKLMTAEGGITENHVIFIIRIPLVDQGYFDLFRPIPIPATINSTVITVKPETEVLAMSPHRDQYFPMSLNELRKCIRLKEETHLCLNKQQTLHRDSRSLMCTISLFNNRTASACNIQKYDENFLWTQLWQKNQWMYGMNTTTQMTAVCGAETLTIDLDGSGLLSMQPDCILRNNLVTIQGHQTIESKVYKSYTSFGDIASIAKPEDIKTIFSANPLNIAGKIEQLTQLQKQLKAHEFTRLPQTIQFDRIHHSIIGYLALICAITVAIWTIFKQRRMNASKIDTIPQPQHEEPNFTVDVT